MKHKSIIIILGLFVILVMCNYEIQRQDWNITIGELLIEYKEQGKSKAFMDEMKKDILSISSFNLYYLLLRTLAYILNCLMIFFFIKRERFKSNFSVVLVLTTLIAACTDIVVNLGYFSLHNTARYILACIFLDLAIYFYLQRKKNFLMLISAFISLFVLQLIDLYTKITLPYKIHVFPEFLLTLLPVIFLTVVFFLKRREDSYYS